MKGNIAPTDMTEKWILMVVVLNWFTSLSNWIFLNLIYEQHIGFVRRWKYLSHRISPKSLWIWQILNSLLNNNKFLFRVMSLISLCPSLLSDWEPDTLVPAGVDGLLVGWGKQWVRWGRRFPLLRVDHEEWRTLFGRAVRTVPGRGKGNVRDVSQYFNDNYIPWA